MAESVLTVFDGGTLVLLVLRQRYSVFGIARRLLELMEMGSDDQTAAEFVDDHAEELVELRRWARIDRFDRRAANRRLAGAVIARAGTRHEGPSAGGHRSRR